MQQSSSQQSSSQQSSANRPVCSTFDRGKPHGDGAWLSAGGREYSGWFDAGLWHGHGVFYDAPMAGLSWWGRYDASGSSLKRPATPAGEAKGVVMYDGEWRNGRPHGAGREWLSTGTHYIGQVLLP